MTRVRLRVYGFLQARHPHLQRDNCTNLGWQFIAALFGSTALLSSLARACARVCVRLLCFVPSARACFARVCFLFVHDSAKRSCTERALPCNPGARRCATVPTTDAQSARYRATWERADTQECQPQFNENSHTQSGLALLDHKLFSCLLCKCVCRRSALSASGC